MKFKEYFTHNFGIKKSILLTVLQLNEYLTHCFENACNFTHKSLSGPMTFNWKRILKKVMCAY